MNKEVISDKQGMSIIILFILGGSSIMVSGLSAKTDLWLSMIIALLFSSLYIRIYYRLLNILPDKNIYETLETLLGGVLSRMLLLPLIWFSFDLCSIVLRNFGQFINTVGLTETPLVVPIICVMLLSSWIVKEGVETLGRWGELFVIFLVIFLMVQNLFLFPEVNFNNIRPVLNSGIMPIVKGSIEIITFPFLETVSFLLVLPQLKNKNSAQKIYLSGLLIGGSVLMLSSVTNILVLGVSNASRVFYPIYFAARVVKLGGFTERLEIIAALAFLFGMFVKISVLHMGTVRGLSWVFKLKNYYTLAFPISILIICNTIFSFTNFNDFHDFTFMVWPFYAVPFQIILPVIMLILVETKYRKIKKG